MEAASLVQEGLYFTPCAAYHGLWGAGASLEGGRREYNSRNERHQQTW